jgi:hypothetical protein
VVVEIGADEVVDLVVEGLDFGEAAGAGSG